MKNSGVGVELEVKGRDEGKRGEEELLLSSEGRCHQLIMCTGKLTRKGQNCRVTSRLCLVPRHYTPE